MLEELLARSPEMPTRELLEHANRVGYAGGKTAFYAFVAQVRQRAGAAQLPEGMPGAVSLHDVGEVDLTVASGRTRARFVVSRLRWSGWLEVSIVPDDSPESVARALVEHFERFGGVPLLARFEQPKPVARRWTERGEITEWSLGFAHFAAELGVGLVVAPSRGRGREPLGRWMKEAFFRVGTFDDRDDAATKLADFRDAVNREVAQDGGDAPLVLIDEERRRLRRLPERMRDFAFRVPCVVGPGGEVAVGGQSYAMPPAAAGTLATALLGRDVVRIEAGSLVVTHPRLEARGATSVRPEHRRFSVEPPRGRP